MSIRGGHLWKWVIMAAMVGAIMLFATIGREPFRKGLELLQHMGPVPFYAVLTLCISFGAPATPFLLVAGAAFGFWTNLVGLAISFSVSLGISYVFANRLFKTQLNDFLQNKAGSLNRVLQQNIIVAIALLRLTPGVPYIIQNCLLASVAPNFAVFFLASLPPLLFIASLYVALGGGLVHANVPLLVLSVAVLLGVVFAMRRLAFPRR